MSIRSYVNFKIAVPVAISKLHDWEYMKMILKKRNSRRSNTARNHNELPDVYDRIIKSESFQYSNSPLGSGLLRMNGSRF